MNTNIFRAYDIRGNAEKDLDSSTIQKIGYVLGLKVKKNNSNFIFLIYQGNKHYSNKFYVNLCMFIKFTFFIF